MGPAAAALQLVQVARVGLGGLVRAPYAAALRLLEVGTSACAVDQGLLEFANQGQRLC